MRLAGALLLLLLGCSTPTQVAVTPASYDENSACAEAPLTSPICRADVSDVDEATARTALGEQEFTVVREGDHFTAFARVPAETANLCCSLQGPMTRIGETELFAARYRLADLDHAALTFFPPAWFVNQRQFGSDDAYRWFGPDAPPRPAFVAELRGERFERTLWSEHLQETRRIYVYLPPGYDRTRQYPALFIADGASAMVLAPMVEGLILDGKIAPIVLVGAGSGQAGIVEDRSSLGIADLRSADYLPGFNGGGDRYEQHLRFFTEELVDYTTREFNISTDRSQRAVSGFSNGGSFSVFAALRRPDVFGVSMPLSPSWRFLTDADFAQPERARFLMSVGLYEIQRGRRAAAYAESLRARGYDVVLEQPAMGHDHGDHEAAMLARFLPLAFPGPQP